MAAVLCICHRDMLILIHVDIARDNQAKTEFCWQQRLLPQAGKRGSKIYLYADEISFRWLLPVHVREKARAGKDTLRTAGHGQVLPCNMSGILLKEARIASHLCYDARAMVDVVAFALDVATYDHVRLGGAEGVAGVVAEKD